LNKGIGTKAFGYESSENWIKQNVG